MNRLQAFTRIATCLQVAQVAGSDNFFDLGGDSLAALELVEVLSDGLGRDVEIDEIIAAVNFDAMLQSLGVPDRPAAEY